MAEARSARQPIRVLHIAYWGLLEPLGRSLILPLIRKLATPDVQLTVVTFDKPRDLARKDEKAQTQRLLDQLGIEWIPLRYHKTPKIPATAFDMANGVATGLLARLRHRYDVVYGRTFVGGLMGFPVSKLLGVPFVYHNEGFYPDEQVDGGVWRRGSLPHRIARWLERRLYSHASGNLVLSHQAKRIVAALPRSRPDGAPVLVVPSAVDSSKFTPRTPVAWPSEEVRFIYLGSVGYRYRLDLAGRFIAAAAQRFRRVSLTVLSPASPSLIREQLARDASIEYSLEIDRVPHEQVPAELVKHHLGLYFLSAGMSEHGVSPTKIGEYWAAGLPVVATPGSGDIDTISQEEGVGVILSHEESNYSAALDGVERLLGDPETPGRCRRAAEQHYSLDAAAEGIRELWTALSRERT